MTRKPNAAPAAPAEPTTDPTLHKVVLAELRRVAHEMVTSPNFAFPVQKVWFTPREAGEYVALHHVTLEKLRRSNVGPRYTKVGKTVRYKRDWMDQWLLAGASPSEKGA